MNGMAENFRSRFHGTLLSVFIFWAGYLLILLGAGMLGGSPLVWGSVSSAGVLLLTMLFLRLERRGAAEIGLAPDRGSAARFLLGTLFGLALFAAHLLVIRVFAGPIGFARADGHGWSGIATFLALSCMEELGYRGYPLRTLEARLGRWPAQLIVAVVFTLNHLLYGWTLPKAAGVLPPALLFGAVALRSRGLAMPIALHAAWNVADWASGGFAWPAGTAAVAPVSYVVLFLVSSFFAMPRRSPNS